MMPPGGAAPFARSPLAVQSAKIPVLLERRPLGILPLWGAAPLQNHALGAPAFLKHQEKSAVSVRGSKRSRTPKLEVCPGDRDNKCNTHRRDKVCMRLLDGKGKPLLWGNDGHFWDITGQAGMWDSDIRWNEG